MRASTSLTLIQRGLSVALVGGMLVAASGSACAGGREGAVIGGAALGLLGGVALGAALASPPPPPPPYYRPRPIYVEDGPRPIYVAPRPRGPICHFEQRKVWFNEVEFTYRRVEVCE